VLGQSNVALIKTVLSCRKKME